MNARFELPTNLYSYLLEMGAGASHQNSMTQQLEKFSEIQRNIFKKYDSFSHVLLERQRSAADEAMTALRKMNGSTEPAEWAKFCTEWFARSAARAADDARDIMTEGFKLFAEMSQTVTAEMAETVKATAQPGAAPRPK